MPDECATMRSIARCVLPVLVGPRTAVTPTPRARASRLWGGEKERGIAGALYHNGRRPGPPLRVGTSLERIAAESVLTPFRHSFPPNLGRLPHLDTTSCVATDSAPESDRSRRNGATITLR